MLESLSAGQFLVIAVGGGLLLVVLTYTLARVGSAAIYRSRIEAAQLGVAHGAQKRAG